MRRLHSCILLVLLVLGGSAGAADVRRYALADRGAIVFTVPDGWREEVHRAAAQLPPTIVFYPSSGAAFQFLVTPLWPFKPDIPRPSVETVRESVRRAADSARSRAVETELRLEQFKGTETFASYFSATDQAPKPGEYKHMTQGMMGLADLRVTFTVLVNDDREVIVPKALDMLRGARLEAGGGNAR